MGYSAVEYLNLPHVIAYLNELAAQIVLDGGIDGVDLSQAVTAAHDKRQKFLAEMLSNETPRSQMARMVLAVEVRSKARQIEEESCLLKRLEEYAADRNLKDARNLIFGSEFYARQ